MRTALVDLSEGSGGALVIHGPAGIGKSRLMAEVIDGARRRRIPVHTGKASPFGSPLAVMRALVLSLLGLSTRASMADRAERTSGLADLDLFPRDIEALESLVGVRTLPVDASEVWVALRRLLAKLSERQALVMVLEDAHHLPDRERARLSNLWRRLSRVPVLFLVTVRGDVAEGFEHAERVHLGPVDAAAQRRLVASVLEAETVDAALDELLATTCEGNPLYLAELARWLEDSERVQVVDGQARLAHGDGLRDLPDGLAGLMAARIDALGRAAKGALQLAAVIGPTFEADLLSDVIGLDDIGPLLEELDAAGLVEAGPERGTWAFRSTYVRQAALRGILGVQRRDLHRLVAGALERRLPTAGDAWHGVLALHCGEGGRFLDAARYAFADGRRHEASQALEPARRAYSQGLAWIGQAPHDPETWDAQTQGSILLRLRLGVVQRLLGQGRAARRTLALALDEADEAGMPWLEVRLHLELGRTHLDTPDLVRARAHLSQAAALARLESDDELVREVLEARAELAHEAGTPEEAIELWTEALGAADHAGGSRERAHGPRPGPPVRRRPRGRRAAPHPGPRGGPRGRRPPARGTGPPRPRHAPPVARSSAPAKRCFETRPGASGSRRG